MSQGSETSVWGIECFLGPDGLLNDQGKEVLAALLGKLPPVHRGLWGPAFVPLMSKLVPVAVEIAIVRGNQVLLTHRKDVFWDGWHFPGNYMGPGETWQDAASRCAERELGVSVRVNPEPACFFNHPDNPRFHDLCVLFFCEIIAGKPQNGSWFESPLPGLIPIHEKYRGMVEAHLRRSA